jgi:hypothetical protein
MHVHLLLPDLLIPDLLAEKAAASALAGGLVLPGLPALETLMARARRSSMAAYTSAESWLADRYDLPDRTAAAPYSLLGDGGDPGQARWLRADPVHLRADRDALVLADASVFSLAPDESEALAASLSRHFGPSLQFQPATPERWYARMDAGMDKTGLRWTPLALARGKPLAAQLPQGEGAMRWNALVNELQMLLHAHPVNAEREARGELPVNSVWLWGEGELAIADALHSRPWGRVFADDPLARGLAMASGGSAAPLPANASSLLSHSSNSAPESGRVLILLDSLRASAAYGDAPKWMETLEQLERDWFAPLLAALSTGRIGMLTLSCPGLTGPDGQAAGGIEAEVIRSDLRRFWRRRKPLARYVSLESAP